MISDSRYGPRLVLGGLVACALVLAAFCLMLGFPDPNRLSQHDWRLFLENYVSADGRVIDTGNNSVSHSEGQSYGLFLAVAFRDRPVFDRVWNWTRQHLQTRPDDKLLSWLWKPTADGLSGSVADPNNASDGDVVAAWALLRAFELWGDPAYQRAANQILADLARLDLRSSDFGPVLLPGTDGFDKEDGLTLNPSYFIFPAFAAFAATNPAGPWGGVMKTALLLIGKARFGKWELSPDWVLVGEGSLALPPGFPPVFGYNAIRVPLYLNWGPSSPSFAQPFARFWSQFSRPSQIPATVNLENNEFGPDPALPGMRAVAAFTMARFSKQTLTVSSLPELRKEESYFSASLNLLTKVAIRDSFAQK
ncbi:hypothetical protein BH09VER1_BH09VER1_30380 [soil metagenome]